MYDVLVVGGGPAGLSVAARLARAGRAVALFEEHPQIGLPVHCTGLLASEAFVRFSLPHEAILVAHRATRFRSSSSEAFQLAALAPLDRVIRERTTFNWHSGLIQALARDRQVRSFLLRTLLGHSLRFIRRGDTATETLASSEPSPDGTTESASTV